ncbi:MAG: HAD family hydrolase [Vampirovibrionales bacterium]|nr:HAD family hydrolase [Vampirovibrionales bacterium]
MTIAVFLDRDGTLNQEAGYIREIDKLTLIPGAAQAVRRLNDAGLLSVLTTNQSGVARGFYDEAHILALHARLAQLLEAQAGARLDAYYYCPFHERGVVEAYRQDSPLRKPATGMIDRACEAFPAIDRARSFVVGDKPSDVSFAVNAGCRSVMLKTGYGARALAGQYQQMIHPPERICDSIVEAVDWILSQTATAHAAIEANPTAAPPQGG